MSQVLRKLTSLLLLPMLGLVLLGGTQPIHAFSEDSLSADPDEVSTWIVMLSEPPAARYRGGIAGYMATSAKSRDDRQFDANAPEVEVYRSHLAQRQQDVLGRISELTGLPAEAERQWQLAANGFAITMSALQAEQVERLSGVRRVFEEQELIPLTFAGPDHVGGTDVWEGVEGAVTETRGEGIVVGIIDSGVNLGHDSFAGTAPADGYEHDNPLGEGNYLGACDPDHPDYEEDLSCNDKLIGAYDYTGSGAADNDGHGSHVAGTAAGNEMTTPDGEAVSGVAPRANIVSFKICDGGCTGVLDVAEDILADGVVDVVNFSIGPILGGGDPYAEESAQAFLSLSEAGVLVAAAGGNAGEPGTISNFAPWNLTVANSSHDGMMAHEISITGPGSDIPDELVEINGLPGDNPHPDSDIDASIVDVGELGDELACESLPDDSLSGAVGVAVRGECQFDVKAANLEAAGAIAMIVVNDIPGAPIAMGGLSDAIPAAMIDRDDGDAIRDWLASEDDATVFFSQAVSAVFVDEAADVMSPSSSIGPGQAPYNQIPGPDVAAPGTNILAPWYEEQDDFNIISGTSMASPHAAGGLALMRSLYPDWTPPEIQSALMMTAKPDPMRKQDGQTPADIFDRGSGRLDLAAAVQAGLVMDETIDNFEAADPELAELELHELNVPYLSALACTLQCEWTRTVTATAEGSWEVLVDNDNSDFEITVSPQSFTLQVGESQEIEVTALGFVPDDSWAFAELTLSETSGNHPDARLPMAINDLAGPVAVDAEREADTGLSGARGIAAGRDQHLGELWLGTAEQQGEGNELHGFDIETLSATGDVVTVDWLSDDAWPAAITYSVNSESYWQLETEPGNCLHEWRPDEGATGEVICPDWPEPVRAVTHDPYERVFWAGGADGNIHQINHDGEVLASHDTSYSVAGLALAPLSGQLYVSNEGDEPFDVAVLDSRDELEPLMVYALRDSDGNPVFGDFNQADIHLACDNRLWLSHPGQDEMFAYDLGEEQACPQSMTQLDLDGIAVPGAGQTNSEYKTLRFVGPDQLVGSFQWDLVYDAAQGNGQADEFRMEIESPDGTVIRVGGRENSAGALPSEELDYVLGWPNEGDAVVSDAQSIDDFQGESANGIWQVRLWSSFGLGLQYGLLIDDSQIGFTTQLPSPSLAPDGGDFVEEEGALAVQITGPEPPAVIRYTLDGSTPGPDNGNEIESGETVMVDEDLTLKAIALPDDEELEASPVVEADYHFHPAVVFESEDGEEMGDPSLAAGETVEFQVAGGSGQTQVEADPNAVSGVEGELDVDGEQGSFTVPEEGAFAGSYRITVTDNATGATDSFDVIVDLETESDRRYLVVDESEAMRVLGATPDYGFSFQVTADGAASSIASVDPEQADASDDAEAANPALTQVTVEEADGVEAFAVEVTPEDGSYDAVAHDMEADEGQPYAGWIQDESQTPLEGAMVSTAEPVGPAERYYSAESDADGVFAFTAPSLEEDESRQLSASLSGYVSRQLDAIDCEGSSPQCTVTLYQSTAEIQGDLLGLLAEETVSLYLLVSPTDADEEELGPHHVTGSGDGVDPFTLDVSHEAHYPEIRVEGFGYESQTADGGGDGFEFQEEGQIIADEEIEMVPTTPEIVQVEARDRDEDSLTLVAEVAPRERETNVVFEWGDSSESLDETLEAGTLDAHTESGELSAELDGLECGSTFHFRARAENDQSVSAESETSSVSTEDCPATPEPPSSSSSSGCSLGEGRSPVDPTLPWLLLLAGLFVLRRRA
ncbi:subtilisin family serine protease [Natronospira proteinivora]|uniref:Subtilisin family serine protease n=1 Tax=Natronospira proteinivora TaxID=1807133 RepID=A0ABT1GAH9_9GAMM|nr:S8 family serine peptidase [Natronospira proteinivora]MCP1727915.1 subtilisin family serine protease [Natronospira proteinivora]